jgi:hypothetical protein
MDPMENTCYCCQEYVLLAHYLAMDICEPHRKHLFWCQECVFIGLLPGNGYMLTMQKTPSCDTGSIVACTYFWHCLEMGLHVTI